MSAFRFLPLAAALLLLVVATPLPAGYADVGWVDPPTTQPSLSAVHPGTFALFQLLVSVTALVAFPPRR